MVREEKYIAKCRDAFAGISANRVGTRRLTGKFIPLFVFIWEFEKVLQICTYIYICICILKSYFKWDK